MNDLSPLKKKIKRDVKADVKSVNERRIPNSPNGDYQLDFYLQEYFIFGEDILYMHSLDDVISADISLYNDNVKYVVVV